MKLKSFKEKDKKKIGIILFTITCILLITGVVLFRTFAIFEVNNNFNVINGTIEDPGDIYFAFYVKNEENEDYVIQKNMPRKEDGYVLDESRSYCGVTGKNDSNIKVFVTEDNMIHVSGVSTSRTKCNLYFTKGQFILGKGIPLVSEGDGLYIVKHDNLSGTVNDPGFQTTEYRYAGASPNNYIKFNDEDWRIIGLVNVMTSENKVEQRVKIVRKEQIGYYSWDTTLNSEGINRGKNKWNNAQVMTILNDYYYNSKSDQQCWVYEASLKAKQTSCSFDGKETHVKGLKNVWNMIDENIIWTLGEGFETTITTPNAYQQERIVNNDDNKWPNEASKSTFHSIGLIYPSDYGYAYGNRECTENNQLGNQTTNCYETNWFFYHSENTKWLITTSTKDEYKVQNLPTSKHLYDGSDAYGDGSIYPTLYLKTNIKITSGNGSSENPYNLVQIF